MRIAIAVLMTAGLAACSGGPLKERPVVEAPVDSPEPPAVDAPEPAPEPAPQPPPPPAPPPPRDIARSELGGWWTSTSAVGAGSAFVRRIDLIFNDDGRFEGAAVVRDDSGLALRTTRGTFELKGANLSLAYEDGRTRTFDIRYQEPHLVLLEKDGELRLERPR